MLHHQGVLSTFIATIIFVVGCSGGGDDTGKVTKVNVLKVTDGMSIDDAKLILGPPTREVKFGGYLKMEWGDVATPGPFIEIEYDKDSLKITRKRVIGMD